MIVTKKCDLCKKPAISSSGAGRQEKWICPSCRAKADEQLAAGDNEKNGELCHKCKNSRNGKCRFNAEERRKITACSDWSGKNTEHDKRRWAKFEQ